MTCVCWQIKNSDSKRERDQQEGVKGKVNILRDINDKLFPYREKDGI